ncbi:hypothetical protein B0J14DRAFT_214934 [Halenospora varia]|nr:hypothetical protein B0J14DRAFT_214934 [Halenospora varia]
MRLQSSIQLKMLIRKISSRQQAYPSQEHQNTSTTREYIIVLKTDGKVDSKQDLRIRACISWWTTFSCRRRPFIWHNPVPSHQNTHITNLVARRSKQLILKKKRHWCSYITQTEIVLRFVILHSSPHFISSSDLVVCSGRISQLSVFPSNVKRQSPPPASRTIDSCPHIRDPTRGENGPQQDDSPARTSLVFTPHFTASLAVSLSSCLQKHLYPLADLPKSTLHRQISSHRVPATRVRGSTRVPAYRNPCTGPSNA